MTEVSPISGAEALYRSIAGGGAPASRARAQLALRSWLCRLAEVDARTGMPLPQTWSALCRRAADNPDSWAAPADQLGAILAHVAGALRYLMAQPRRRIVRSHAMVPLHAARELDSRSIAWLGRQTGRTVREKLAGKPGMLAVQRQSSLDTLENRLLRAFCMRLEHLLSARCAVFPGNVSEEELLADLRHWLRDDAESIGDWGHVPPNNALLQDRHYRKVWDGWMLLQHLDAQVDRDGDRLSVNWLTVLRWKLAGRLHLSGQVWFPEQPCYVANDAFSIDAERGPTLAGLPVDARESGWVDHLGEGEKGGYGFIRSGAARLYFRHRAMLNASDFQKLRRGTRVQFTLSPDGKACAVEILDERRGAPRLLVLRPLDASGFELVLGEQAITVRLAVGRPGKPGVMLGAETVGIDGFTLEEADRVVERLCVRLLLAARGPVASAMPRPMPGTPAVVDLASLRPAYAAGAEVGELPFRLLRQYWDTAEGEVALDLGEASAATIRAHTPLLSMTDLIQGRDTADAGRREEAALAFAARLAEFFGDVPLTYLTPDSVDDFALGAVRRGLNTCFTRTDPLPRSIAALFDWLRSGRDGSEVTAGDYVLVLDNAGGAVTVTPLQAHAAPAFADCVTETQGLAWEKLPVTAAGTEASLEALATAMLSRQRCAAAEELGAWMGGQEADGSPGLAWEIEPKGWFQGPHRDPVLPAGAQQALLDVLKRVRDRFRRGNRCLAVVLACGDEGVMRPLVKALARADWPTWPAHSLVGGAAHLLELRERAGSEPLWYERLPDLSIRIPAEGRYRRFHLVRDRRVEPRRGIAQAIPVDEVFTLPAGHNFLQLPLCQGSLGQPGKVLSYQLRIASSAFPLKRDVPALLHLSFSYGSNDPYALSFIPCDPAQAGFVSVRASWVATDAHALAAHVPAPPAVRSWADLQRQWKSAELAVLHQRLSAVYHAFIKVRAQGYRKDEVRHLVQRMRRDLRWLMLDIWSDGRSIGDQDCPAAFSHAMRSWIPMLAPLNAEIWLESAVRDEVRELAAEFMFLMCSLRADMPFEAEATVREQVERSLQDRQMLGRARLSLACLLGHPDKQRELLGRIMTVLKAGESATQAVVVDLLGVALWRNPELLEIFDADQLRLTIAALGQRLQVVGHKIGARGGVSGDLGNELRDCLEVLLALLRTRASPQAATAKVLAVGAPAVSELAGVLERMEPQVCQPDTLLRPRIVFESNKPAMLEATPDLLYLTNLYLLGESGIGQIRITGVVDED